MTTEEFSTRHYHLFVNKQSQFVLLRGNPIKSFYLKKLPNFYSSSLNNESKKDDMMRLSHKDKYGMLMLKIGGERVNFWEVYF